jgi:hypothetical protein
MATWKKIIISGSNISQLNNDAGYVTNSTVVQNNSFATASFNGNLLLANSSSGSLFFASSSGQGLTIAANTGTDTLTFGLAAIPNASLANTSVTIGSTPVSLGGTITSIAGLTLTGAVVTGSFTGSFTGVTNLPDLTQGAGISSFTYDGSAIATIAVSGASALSTNNVNKWSGTAFVNSSLSDNGTVVSGASSIQLTGASSSLTGSFTGSFKGDGSGLTGLASTLDISGSNGTGISISLVTQDLTIGGTANEIETSAAGTTLTIGLPNDVTIGQDLIVSRNLTVLGTASFQSTTNLDVADRFIRLASGSTTSGDGGIAVQQTTSTNSELFGFDSGVTRWGVTSSFDPAQSSYTPDAFMALALNGGGVSPTSVPVRYQANGNIFIGSDESIWIYS